MGFSCAIPPTIPVAYKKTFLCSAIRRTGAGTLADGFLLRRNMTPQVGSSLRHIVAGSGDLRGWPILGARVLTIDSIQSRVSGAVRCRATMQPLPARASQARVARVRSYGCGPCPA